ncbi:MAG: hydratase, partial [Acutalibacter sp.]
MIKLHEGGVYLVDGQLVPAAQAQGDPRLQDATPQQAKKATIAYSILQAHNHSSDPASLQIRFDALASHDITYVGIIQTARAS